MLTKSAIREAEAFVAGQIQTCPVCGKETDMPFHTCHRSPLKLEHDRLESHLVQAAQLYEASKASGDWVSLQIAAQESARLATLLILNEQQQEKEL